MRFYRFEIRAQFIRAHSFTFFIEVKALNPVAAKDFALLFVNRNLTVLSIRRQDE